MVGIERNFFQKKTCTNCYLNFLASPGQRRGSCGHIIAVFDCHDKCTLP